MTRSDMGIFCRRMLIQEGIYVYPKYDATVQCFCIVRTANDNIVIGLLLLRFVDVTDTVGMIFFALALFVADFGICTLAGKFIRQYLPKTFSMLSR